MKKLFVLIILLMAVIVVVRFVLGGEEDDWICQYGQWVKHGNPSSEKPEGSCGPKIIEKTTKELEDISRCLSSNGSSMTYLEAKEVAVKVCSGGSLKDDHVCNESTGSWWIDFTPNFPKEGCNPACVVDVEKKTAEINWRCTGLKEPSI